MTKATKIEHWTPQEDLQYYFYIILKYRELLRKKKVTKFYTGMAKFMQKKTSRQCKTHHEKKILQMKKSHPNQEPELSNVISFYNQAIKIRRLDRDHLKMEINLLLQEKRQGRVIKEEDYWTYKASIEEILIDLAAQQPTLPFKSNQPSPHIHFHQEKNETGYLQSQSGHKIIHKRKGKKQSKREPRKIEKNNESIDEESDNIYFSRSQRY